MSASLQKKYNTYFIYILYSQDFKLNSRQIEPLDFGFLWAQRAIAIYWKSINTSSFKRLIEDFKKAIIKVKILMQYFPECM